ncbi:hypothetical protein RR48_03449 [Papilio machaon]|uniref:Uncharacterized protein n=1 Tax=Papilio machaon TaxID=76193 RepID=A0A0N0PB26_PAPMA|nr:hypothetical protein RR48_03449 [Papilio machaon]
MDVKFVIIFICLLALLPTPGHADFLYNRISPKTPEELDALNLKCAPGRTILKIESVSDKSFDDDDGTEEDDGEIATDTRRVHMKFPPKDDSCKICVCSVEGKDEYCSKRPAMNVNECMRMTMINDSFNKNIPFDHERSLSYRIRRDYLWHKDEIPYSASSLCLRGMSYYTNNENANNSTIAKQMRVVSQLDYGTRNICYFCVCHTSGSEPACIVRNPWFCDYYRMMRRPNYARDRYRYLFKEDRPAYFRQLSYRIRRTMDNGIMELLDKGGDSLCCGHPNGHRRILHDGVRRKLRLLQRKVPRENILAGSPTGDYVDFVVNNDK